MERFVDNPNIYICDNSNLSLQSESFTRFFNDDKIHINEEGAKVFANNIKFSIHKPLNIKVIVKKTSHSPRSDKYIKGEGGQDPKQSLDMNRTQVIKVEEDKGKNLSVMIVPLGNILK